MPVANTNYTDLTWKNAWQSVSFRRKFFIAVLFTVILLTIFPLFFQYIEKREGYALNDWLLRFITPVNVSPVIFLIIILLGLLGVYRAIQQPWLLLVFLYSFIILSIARLSTISLIPLNPPHGLIPLADPISNAVYQNRFVTKDLFFSGHTSSQFLLFLCFTKRTDKLVALAGTIAIAILVLLQHIHYTMDVLAAPVMAYISFLAGKWVSERNFAIETVPHQKASPN